MARNSLLSSIQKKRTLSTSLFLVSTYRKDICPVLNCPKILMPLRISKRWPKKLTFLYLISRTKHGPSSFCVNRQFASKICAQLKGHINPRARGISCIKGVDVSADSITLFPSYISRHLGIYCGALSGANIAGEIAKEKFSETTIAYSPPDFRGEADDVSRGTIRKLFYRPYFHVQISHDVAGVCLCGALKNIVAVAAGLIDGLEWGNNAKAAVIRVGMKLNRVVLIYKRCFGDAEVWPHILPRLQEIDIHRRIMWDCRCYNLMCRWKEQTVR